MKKNKKAVPKEPSLPRFEGFRPLASGLGELAAKIEAERKAAETAKKKPAPAPPPRPAAPPPKRTAESDRDDEMTFHRMMSGVTPLEGRTSRVAVAKEAREPKAAISPSAIKERAQAEARSVLDHLHHLVDDAVRFEVTDDGAHVEGRRVDVPPKLVRDLRRGVLPVDGKLDLHGHTAETARETLLEFLKSKRANGERVVLVIHGKGHHSPGGGVLRGEIAAWLSQGRAREHVAAFATAPEEDGGAGAVYVALRK